MRTIVASALALGAMTSVALATEPTSSQASSQAGPVDLTDTQMDGITAGGPGLVDIEIERNEVAVAVPVSAAANVCAIIAACAAGSAQDRPGRIQQ
jgi:hypothetical protein